MHDRGAFAGKRLSKIVGQVGSVTAGTENPVKAIDSSKMQSRVQPPERTKPVFRQVRNAIEALLRPPAYNQPAALRGQRRPDMIDQAPSLVTRIGLVAAKSRGFSTRDNGAEQLQPNFSVGTPSSL